MKKNALVRILLSVLMLLMLDNGAVLAQKKTNVLFIVADDMRPTLKAFGDPVAITPNIDRIAQMGTTFVNAYCQVAVCNPSRASFMTGRRPNTTKVWDLRVHFRQALPDVLTIPQWFMKNGYRAQSAGKIYHDPAALQDPVSWSSPAILGVTPREGKYVLDSNNHKTGNWKASATERADAPEIKYIDGMVIDAALKVLDSIKDKPFFLAVGFRRPHLPFSAPEKYWAMYDGIKLPMPPNPEPPKNVPDVALKNGPELQGYTDIPDHGPIPTPEIKKLIHGYYACTTFMDAQVGKLLHELDSLHLTDNTIIVFLGDNGYHLGEQDLWCKATNFENATRVPLIISSPWQMQKGTVTKALVELVDVYPTVAELAGLSLPSGLEGSSVKPLLDNPALPWKKAVFSQFARPWIYKQKDPKLMGYTVRTNDFRYVEWQDFTTGAIKFTELYDHRTDSLESNNVAGEAKYKQDISALHEMLQKGWQSYKPNAEPIAKHNDGIDSTTIPFIYKAGTEGYACFRIPAIIKTKKGTLLAFAEGRKNKCADYGDIDLVVKRSSDNGKSWSALSVVWDDSANTCGNPAPVVDERTGKICLLMTWNLGEDKESLIHSGKSKDTRRVFVSSSSDDGLSWEKPKDITTDTKLAGWSWYATGPCHGIQLKQGKWAGRLVIPCDHVEFANSNGGYSHAIYSDDGGQTWHLGGIVPQDLGNECSVAELSDGTLMMNMRNYKKNSKYRKVSTSADGGTTWSEPYADSTLVEPRCEGSLVSDAEKKKHLLFFSNPADTTARRNMTIRKSTDDGKTWPYRFVVHPGPSAYSDLAIVKNSIAILYEAGHNKPYEGIAFRRIPIKKLKKKN